ncbi:hypothetical protein C8R43DRAFT_1106960 [Mycena crocata]|nr:hypothetical protein C8R43DRAFT_1106960 [Mycena crocata]
MLDTCGALPYHCHRWCRASPPSSLPRHSTRRHRRLFIRPRLNLGTFNIDPTMHQVHVIAALPPPPPTTTSTTRYIPTTVDFSLTSYSHAVQVWRMALNEARDYGGLQTRSQLCRDSIQTPKLTAARINFSIQLQPTLHERRVVVLTLRNSVLTSIRFNSYLVQVARARFTFVGGFFEGRAGLWGIQIQISIILPTIYSPRRCGLSWLRNVNTRFKSCLSWFKFEGSLVEGRTGFYSLLSTNQNAEPMLACTEHRLLDLGSAKLCSNGGLFRWKDGILGSVQLSILSLTLLDKVHRGSLKTLCRAGHAGPECMASGRTKLFELRQSKNVEIMQTSHARPIPDLEPTTASFKYIYHQ